MGGTMVNIIKSVEERREDGNILAFQWCEYLSDESSEFGYRFIWKDPAGRLQPHRGQARIPSMMLLHRLIARACDEGWAHLSADDAREFPTCR